MGVADRQSVATDPAEPLPTPPPPRSVGEWVQDHLLSLILFALFALSLIGQFYFQYADHAQEALLHGRSVEGPFSSDFLNAFAAAALENWQSEFLQLMSFVVLATYFIHRGSPQSRDGTDEMAVDIKAIRKKLGA